MDSKLTPFFCPAGVNFAAVNADGDVYSCTNFMRLPGARTLGNLYQGVTLNETFHACREKFCICPQHKFDPKLYRKSLKQRSWAAWRLPYDLWLHWYVTEECFLSCVYCETGNRPFVKQNIRPIEIPALMRTLNGLARKAVHLSFTGGGEPFAVPNMTEACTEITERHYISFNSNLLGIDMEAFIGAINPQKLLYIQGSLHLKELERTRNIERFARNVNACRRAGVRVNVVAVGIPAIIPEIPKFKAIFEAKGIFFTFAPFSGIYEGRHYPDAYTETELVALGMAPQAVRIHRAERPVKRGGSERVLSSRIFNAERFKKKFLKEEKQLDAGKALNCTVSCEGELKELSALLEQSASLERADYERAWQDIFNGGRELIIGQDEYGKVHKERFWELLNAVSLLVTGKIRPCVMEFGASEFSALYKRFFPGMILHLSDRPTPADYIGFTETVCRRIAGCEAFFSIDLEAPDFLEKRPELVGGYDLILFAEVLEHLVVNPVDLIRRLLKMLRADGSLYLTTPNFFSHLNLISIVNRENPQQIFPAGDGNWDAHHHYREYCLKELLRFVEQAGGRATASYFSACWDAEVDLPVDGRGNIVMVISKS